MACVVVFVGCMITGMWLSMASVLVMCLLLVVVPSWGIGGRPAARGLPNRFVGGSVVVLVFGCDAVDVDGALAA